VVVFVVELKLATKLNQAPGVLDVTSLEVVHKTPAGLKSFPLTLLQVSRRKSYVQETED
jgi:hypothetical protein